MPGKAIGQRVDSFRCAQCSSSVSMETAECSGQPLTHVAINYCLLLSSVLNKGRDADRNITCLQCRMDLQLVFQEYSSALGSRLSIVGYNIKVSCIFCSVGQVGALKYLLVCWFQKSSVIILRNNWPAVHAVNFERGYMGCITFCSSLCCIKKLYCNGTSKTRWLLTITV